MSKGSCKGAKTRPHWCEEGANSHLSARDKAMISRIEDISRECLSLVREKTAIYGSDSFAGEDSLGSKGEFLQIHRKYVRVKRALWRGIYDLRSSAKHRDSLEDVLKDLANSAMITLLCVRIESGKYDTPSRP